MGFWKSCDVLLENFANGEVEEPILPAPIPASAQVLRFFFFRSEFFFVVGWP